MGRVWLRSNGHARDGCDGCVVGQARLGIHAFGRNDAAKTWISCRLRQVGLAWCRPCVIRDKMQVLPAGGGDAEALLHETVRFVPVSVWLALVLILVTATARRVGRLV